MFAGVGWELWFLSCQERYDGDVYSYIERTNGRGLSEDAARPLFIDMINGARHLRQHGWAHGDIKLENFLFRKTEKGGMRVLLADFGFAARLRHSDSHIGKRATGLYCPPEAWPMGHYLPYDGTSADIWSLGVCLAGMLSCNLVGMDATERRCVLAPHLERDGSSQVLDLLHGMLQWDPRDRMSFEDIAAHPWVVAAADPEVSEEAASRCLTMRAGSDETYADCPLEEGRSDSDDDSGHRSDDDGAADAPRQLHRQITTTDAPILLTESTSENTILPSGDDSDQHEN